MFRFPKHRIPPTTGTWGIRFLNRPTNYIVSPGIIHPPGSETFAAARADKSNCNASPWLPIARLTASRLSRTLTLLHVALPAFRGASAEKWQATTVRIRMQPLRYTLRARAPLS